VRPTPGPSGPTLADLVEAQVARTPAAPALAAAGVVLSYAELDERANRLAHHLQGLGVGPDVLVGICAERTPGMAVGLLGILKAGGACVPLDPEYPPERLAFMLEDSGVAVLLTQRQVAGRLPATGPGTPSVVLLDEDGPGSGPGAPVSVAVNTPAGPPRRATTPDHLAYVIYTSGSTGTPKGVMLAHRGLVNHHRAVARLYRLGPGDRVLQFCSLNFDVSVEEIFPTWASGGTVVLRDDSLPILGRPWLDWLRRQQVGVLNLPTAYWHRWVQDLVALGERLPEAVRLVVVGGERALGQAYRTWLRVGGDGARWVNAYGPTEASIMATFFEPPAGGAGLEAGDPPIGRPLPHLTAHVLDADGRPVAEGEAGELYLGGEGLARGYLGRPVLTAERFPPDPFSDRSGARLYRTGDLVRQRPDGELAFLDRLDQQVKVRGFRIECGEVEAALLGHPAVAEAAVVAREDAPGDRRLVAYVVGAAAAATGRELRRFLAGRLPAYMVPTAYATLDALPRLPNGKLDRRALEAPPSGRHPGPGTGKGSGGGGQAGPDPIPASSPAEEVVAAIWSQVLGLDRVGSDDDFFELGGHSLLATQVMAQVREAFAVEIPVRAIFEAPTVAGLAARLEAAGASPAPVPPLVPQPRPPGGRIPLSLPQEQMWALELQAAPPRMYNVTAQHRFAGPADVEILERALAVVVERHEALRTRVVVEDGRPYQSVAATVPLAIAVSRIDAPTPAEAEEELARAVAEVDAISFDLAVAPLFRAHLFRLGDGASELAVTFDHLITDGTSAYIFLSELADAYAALEEDRSPVLRPLPVQYADYSIWQRRWLTDERLRAQLEYWEAKLAGMPLGPAVPFDRIPRQPTRRIASRSLAVPAGTCAALRRLAQRTSSTMFVVSVAAVQALFSRVGEVSDVVLSTTLSGRQRAELEGLIGVFAGVGRIRTDLSGDPPFTEVVARARESVLGLFENQDIPFMTVRRALFPGFPATTIGPAGGDTRPLAALPIELQYFHTGHEGWAPGLAVVERPGQDKGPDSLFFRGQLHPLSLTLLDDGEQLWGEANYKLDFYTEETVERLVVGLERLLAAVADDPGLPVSALPTGLPGGGGTGGTGGDDRPPAAAGDRRLHRPVGTWQMER